MDGKPPFDPNAPFQAVADAKPPFDPSKPFEAGAPAAAPAPPISTNNMPASMSQPLAAHPETAGDAETGWMHKVTQAATGLNEGGSRSILGAVDAASNLLNKPAEWLTGQPAPNQHMVEDAFNHTFVDPAGAPQNRAEQVLRGAGRMAGENLPLMATGAGVAGSGLRSGVTMAEQAGTVPQFVPGLGKLLPIPTVARARGAADAVLEGMARNPVASAVGENAGAAAAGAGGQIGRNVAKDSGGDEHSQETGELVGQLMAGPTAALYSKIAPTRLATKAAVAVGKRVLDNTPPDIAAGALPERFRPNSSYAERQAEQSAYANREGKYEDPNVPAPPEPNFVQRRMDAGQKAREDRASSAASKEFKQIVDQPDAAANLAEAQRLEQSVPGFKPGVAKATQDPALLKLQENLESRATGDELRGVQQAHDANTAAIRTAKENIIAPAESVASAAVKVNGKVYTGNSHLDALEQAAKELGTNVDNIHTKVNDAKPSQFDGWVTDSGRFIDSKEAAKLVNSPHEKLDSADSEFLRQKRSGEFPQDSVATANAGRVERVAGKAEAQAAGVRAKIDETSQSLPETDPSAVGTYLRDTRKSLKGEADARMTELRKGVDPEGTGVVQVEGQKPMSVNAALDRRAQINQDLADHYGATNRDAAATKTIRELQAEKEALDGAIGKVNAPGLKEYNDYYRDEYAPRFLQGASRDVGRFNRNGYEGNRVASEDVPGKFFAPNNISEARQFNKLYGEDAGARQQMTDHALDDLRRTTVDPNTGQIKEGAVNKWLAKNERILNEMPWVREAVNAKNPDELYKRLGQVEQRQRAVADTKVAKLFNQGKNPEQHIDAALNDWQVMKGLRNSVRGDAQGEAALRRAVIDRAPDPMNVDKFKAWLDGNDRSLRQVLDPTHIKSLQDILAAAKIHSTLPRPTGTVDLPGSLADKGAKVFGITVPSLLQRMLSVKQGRMSAEYGVADVGVRALRQFSNKEIEGAWKEALYNPKVAKDLQLMVKGGAATPIQLARMRNYMLSVGLHDTEERAQH